MEKSYNMAVNLHFGQVLELLRHGRSVSRRAWVKGSYILLDFEKHSDIKLYIPQYTEPRTWEITSTDILANDWFLVGE